MVLIGAAILPHSSLILDPTLEDLPPGAEELHTAAKYVGDYVKDHEPDVIVLASPHGINLSETIGIYASRVATGSAEWNRTWSEYKVSANINDEFSIELYHHLQVKGVKAQLCSTCSTSLDYYYLLCTNSRTAYNRA
mgnify:CR=1 FL=1